MREIDTDFEIWRDIDGAEGKYQVSSHGRIKSVARDYYCGRHHAKRIQPEIIMSPSDVKGYKRIALTIGEKRRSLLVHRLVAEAFLPIPSNLLHLRNTRKLQINHKDEDIENNNVANLEWCDASYNVNYGKRNEKMASKNRNGKKSKSVICVETGEVFPSQSEVTRRTGIKQGDISACCKRKGSSHGYHWRLVEL